MCGMVAGELSLSFRREQTLGGTVYGAAPHLAVLKEIPFGCSLTYVASVYVRFLLGTFLSRASCTLSFLFSKTDSVLLFPVGDVVSLFRVAVAYTIHTTRKKG